MRTLRHVAPLLITTLGLFAATSVAQPPQPSKSAESGRSTSSADSGRASDAPRAKEPADDSAAVRSTNAFGLDLYRALRDASPDDNLFISPLSVAMALTMAAEGAAGETEAQMVATLHVPDAATGERAITAIHGAHAALTARFHADAGAATPETHARIELLRAQRSALEAKGRAMAEAQQWREYQEVASRARALEAELQSLLTSVDRFELSIANALWIEKSFDVMPAFVQMIERFYGGGITELDIRGETESSRRRINDWVAERTAQRITDLIPKGALDPSTRLVITNAVYFKGDWADPFDAQFTRDESFTLASGAEIPQKLMRDPARDATGYAAFSGDGAFFQTPHMVPRDPADRPPTAPDEDGFSIVELPYKGETLSMVVIAPRSPNGLQAIESRLNSESLTTWLTHLERRTVDVSIPRFTLGWTDELSGPLKTLGMHRAFTDPALPDGAEFPGMSARADPSQRLFIGAVRHKTWIEVTEQGTEAAAATSVEMAPTSMPAEPAEVPFIPVFEADRPFVFLIRDTTSGAILFVGRMTRPAA